MKQITTDQLCLAMAVLQVSEKLAEAANSAIEHNPDPSVQLAHFQTIEHFMIELLRLTGGMMEVSHGQD